MRRRVFARAPSREMGDSDVRQRADRPGHLGRPAFDLIAAKLLRPLVRPATIRRSSLLERLARGDPGPIVSMVAPAGYGKTTLLSQWAERNGQAFAWVSVDEGDNDPKVLLTYVAEALNAAEPVGRRVFDALASPTSSVPGSVVPRLGHAFSSRISPVVLVLDDVHALHNSECRAALSVLADHVPGGSRLVLAGRAKPPLRTARLRAEGKLMEIGPSDLSLSPAEASSLLRAAEVALGEADVAELHRRTEGWPVGLYLAALYLREGGSLGGAAGAFGGNDRFVSEYMESELLARISRQQRAFLTRTAVLDRMSGPLCEAVLDLPGSGTILAELARSNLLLAALDRLEPGLVPVLRRRAAAWCLHNDLPEAALEYSIAAGDVDEAADLVGKIWLPAYRQGRVTTVQRWIGWLDDRGGIEEHPMTAVWAAIVAVMLGRPVEAERWADALDRWQYGNTGRPDDPAAEAWAAVVRAMLCRRGAEQMRADADEAARGFAATGIVAPVATLMQGIARLLCGNPEGGDAFFENVVGFRELAAPDTLSNALSERSLLAMAHGDWGQAEALASQARSSLRRWGWERPLATAVQARVALHRGDLPAVRQVLVSAQRLRPLLTYAQPHIAVQIRIELIRVHLALSDLAGARTLMREIDDILKRRPGLGTLADEAEALRDRLARERRSSIAGSSALTAAELRILPMLSTHLSFPEIGKELFLSPHTIKSAMKSIYRKLGATTRNEAVTRARELGLLEG